MGAYFYLNISHLAKKKDLYPDKGILKDIQTTALYKWIDHKNYEGLSKQNRLNKREHIL